MKLPSAAECSKALAGFTAAVPFAVAQGFVSGHTAHLILGGCAVVAGFLAPYLAPKNKPAATDALKG